MKRITWRRKKKNKGSRGIRKEHKVRRVSERGEKRNWEEKKETEEKMMEMDIGRKKKDKCLDQNQRKKKMG